jgi:fatty acid synthase subunit alpha
VINSEESTKFQAKRDDFAAQQIELYMRYLNRNFRYGDRLYNNEKSNTLTLQANLDDITREHGDVYIQGHSTCLRTYQSLSL